MVDFYSNSHESCGGHQTGNDVDAASSVTELRVTTTGFDFGSSNTVLGAFIRSTTLILTRACYSWNIKIGLGK